MAWSSPGLTPEHAAGPPGIAGRPLVKRGRGQGRRAPGDPRLVLTVLPRTAAPCRAAW
ncbi:MAG: hypothetical protein OXB98_22985 [Bryobacterales bacterium]|nr:hypothetical protein [Bryobacterales bacterium]